MTKNSARSFLPRFAPGSSMPPGAVIDPAPHEETPDPAGNRAERRRAKRLGIKAAPPTDISNAKE